MFYSDGRKVRRRLIPGNTLLLVPWDKRSSNEPMPLVEVLDLDPYAVAVFLCNGEQVRIGWVPKTHSRMVRALHQDGLMNSVKVCKVSSDRNGHWRASMRLKFLQRTAEEERIQRILGRMVVPNREYAELIASATPALSESEDEHIEVYNDTCFD